jgi:drug/metabolite transporter (DMT)-like permease
MANRLSGDSTMSKQSIGTVQSSRSDTIRTSLIEGKEFDMELFYMGLLYTVAAGSEYWLLNWLKIYFQIELPIFFALVQNASFPLQGLYYLYEKRNYAIENGHERVIDAQKYKSYCILGALNGIVTLSRTIGLTSLPPTLYAIIANTEIVFEGFLTRFYLGRKLRKYQILSIIFVICGVLVSLWDPVKGTFGKEDDSHNTNSKTLVTGILVSLLSRITSSINTILADRFLGRDRKTRIGVYECAFFNALIPFCVIPLAFIFDNETAHWSNQLNGRNTLNTFTVTAVVTMICLAKWGDRISKFSVVQKASTMLFAILDANMKFIAVVGTFIFFHEKIIGGEIIGFIFIVFSLIVSLYDKKIKLEEEERKETEARDFEAEVEQEGGLRESELSVLSHNTMTSTSSNKQSLSLTTTRKPSFSNLNDNSNITNNPI